ncbi:MAG: copper resistance protein B [Balneolaceae bacterium]|nr:copper resistance protein B [Balneolaceae bacterium]
MVSRIVETSVALQDVPEWGVGSGFNDIGLGFRLRYEFAREFAPYIGINWERKLGETADMARAGGGHVSQSEFAWRRSHVVLMYIIVQIAYDKLETIMQPYYLSSI